jgi:tetratricopeptide (TPR) repeat protein
LYKRNPEATRKAFEYFQQAVQYDPNFAAAYVGIGDCYFAGVGPTGNDAFVHAESFAQKALTIDETIPGAHSTVAYARMHEFDWPTADREFRRALELDPANPSGYYVEFLMSQGRFEETLAIAERMRREDPVAILAVHGLGMIYFYARRYDDALGAFQKALELDPNYYWSLLRSAQTKEQMGNIPEATPEFEKLGPRAEVFLARAYALGGETLSARQILTRILSDPNRTKEFTYEIALVHAGLKENDKALDWLERAYNDRSYHMIYIKIDPRLDPLRADPRFQQLLRRIGLSP